MKIMAALKGLSLKKKIIAGVVIAAAGVGIWKLTSSRSSGKVTYETATAEKGTLVTTISGSGTITSGNNTNVTTKVSGTVTSVYVTNGDKVTKGQKIAEVELDDYAKERQTAAWVTYLNATEAVKEAVNNKAVADISMWNARQDVLDAQEAYDDMQDDGTNPSTHAAYTDTERMVITKTLDQSRKAFSVYESKYLNSDADIANANANVAAALRNYQENSATIYAPASGTISDLALAPGIIVSANSSTSSTTGSTIVSSQTVGKISNSSGQLIATVNLAEVDIVNVKADQKVSITLDAYEDKSFTGRVLAINTSGSVSSGVTSYPVTILLDPTDVEIYPNMAVNVEIITNIKNDVVMIPSTAISAGNNGDTVQIKKGNEITTVDVEAGIANDSMTEIVSGVNEGDEVVTATIQPTSSSSTSSSSTTSPFSGIGRSSSSSTTRSSAVMIGGGPGGF